MSKTVNDLFRQSKQDWLEEARQSARKLLSVRYSITIEDVLEVTPLPRYLHHNTIGRVFSNEDFKAIGYTPSRRTAMHGRVVRLWTSTLPSEREAVRHADDLPKNWRRMRHGAGLLEVE